MCNTIEYFDDALQRARKDNHAKVAVRIISNKTDDCIVWMTPDEAKNYHRLHKRTGQRSTLRNVMDNGGRLQ